MVDSSPGPEPEPPHNLARRELPLRVVAEPMWFRGHRRACGPLHFNQESGRFRVPAGTLYLGTEPHGAFVEAFVNAFTPAGPGYVVSLGLLEQSCLCVVTAKRPVRLVDLTSSQTLKRLSRDADARISTGSHAVSQRWALAFWHHPEQPDGIVYPCRHGPETASVALFARVEADLVAKDDPNVLNDPYQLAALLDRFACALVP